MDALAFDRLPRRDLLLGSSALVGAALVPRFGLTQEQAAGPLTFGQPTPFDFNGLIAEAQNLAASPYEEPSTAAAGVLDGIDFNTYQKIQYRPEATLWSGLDDTFPIRLFHLGRYFQAPVSLHVVENGTARRILYSPALFDFADTGLAGRLPEDLGFAGFRTMNRNAPGDWMAFLGASYFRTAGAENQFGLSARGVAVDTAMPWPEEFPRFTSFWLDREPGERDRLTIYALLDGPSLAGAYRIRCTKDQGVVMEVQAELFTRKDIARLGIAPLTSMFWYGENNREQARDWRPEVHDSDGLALWTGSGERLWRPLINPPAVRTNSYVDRDPRGFGLLQRDREFHNYEDDGVFYDRRPSLWVEPLGSWGAGAVQLVEIPTDDHALDNIVAYWVPEAEVRAGTRWSFSYRLHWVSGEPFSSRAIATARHTRLGPAGVPGQPRPENGRKFVIDFEGGQLADLHDGDGVEAIVSASRGEVRTSRGEDGKAATWRIKGTERWRAYFDLFVSEPGPVDLRCYLKRGEETLSETWIYQYLPGTITSG